MSTFVSIYTKITSWRRSRKKRNPLCSSQKLERRAGTEKKRKRKSKRVQAAKVMHTRDSSLRQEEESVHRNGSRFNLRRIWMLQLSPVRGACLLLILPVEFKHSQGRWPAAKTRAERVKGGWARLPKNAPSEFIGTKQSLLWEEITDAEDTRAYQGIQGPFPSTVLSIKAFSKGSCFL